MRTTRRSTALLATGVIALGGLTAACEDNGGGIDDNVEQDVEDDLNDVEQDVQDDLDDVDDDVQDGVDNVQDEVDGDPDDGGVDN